MRFEAIHGSADEDGAERRADLEHGGHERSVGERGLR